LSAIFVAMGASFFVAVIFLILYLFSVKKGQFDDTYTPSVRILFDENDEIQTENKQIETNINNSNEKQE